MTFDLKYDGTTLTGTAAKGGGGQPIQISDTKFDGTNVTFSVKREFNGQTMVTTCTGTFRGDDLKLKETRQGRNGDQTSGIAAKRASS